MLKGSHSHPWLSLSLFPYPTTENNSVQSSHSVSSAISTHHHSVIQSRPLTMIILKKLLLFFTRPLASYDKRLAHVKPRLPSPLIPFARLSASFSIPTTHSGDMPTTKGDPDFTLFTQFDTVCVFTQVNQHIVCVFAQFNQQSVL